MEMSVLEENNVLWMGQPSRPILLKHNGLS